MERIFISYAHVDGQRTADLLYTRLQGAGYTVWKDDQDLRLGEPFVKAIANAVEAHEYVLLVLSPAALASHWVEYETLLAETAQRRIIPILSAALAHEALPLHLRRWQALHLGDNEGMALHKLVNDLAGATIPRVVNLSGQSQLKAKNALILAEAPFRRVDLTLPAEISAYGVELAQFALPYIRQVNAGLVLPGLSGVAGVTLAYLLGLYNALPRIFVPHSVGEHGFQIDGTNPIALQDLRDAGFRQRAAA